jgi:hypothetical protein
MIVPTVKVCKPTEIGGYRIINQSDYEANPGAYELFDEEVARKALADLKEERSGPQTSHTIDKSGRWTVKRDSEIVAQGRGKATLDAFLQTLA